jgi:hypothetical protein
VQALPQLLNQRLQQLLVLAPAVQQELEFEQQVLVLQVLEQLGRDLQQVVEFVQQVLR